MLNIFKNRILNIFKRNFVKDTITLQIGSFFSSGISFIASIIYARVLGINGYASYALIFSFVGLAGIFTNVGTNQATLTILAEAFAKSHTQQIKDILTYYLKVTLAISIVVGLVVISIAPLVTSKLYDSAEIGQLSRLIILANIVAIFWGMYSIVLQATREIKRLTIIENLNKIFTVAIPALLVLLGFGLTGLAAGYLLVSLVFLVVSWVGYQKIKNEYPVYPFWRDIFSNFFKVKIGYYFKFGFLIAVDKNISSLYSTLPIFILGIYNLQAVAFFKVASTYAGIPLILITPVSRLLMVQLPKSKSFSLSILKRDFLKSSIASFVLAATAAAFFMIFPGLFISLVYGPNYANSISLAYPLLVATAIIALGVGNGSILRTLNIMKQAIAINSATLITGTLILFYFIKNFSINIAIYPIAFWLPVVTIIFYFYILSYLNRRIKIINENNENISN